MIFQTQLAFDIRGFLVEYFGVAKIKDHVFSLSPKWFVSKLDRLFCWCPCLSPFRGKTVWWFFIDTSGHLLCVLIALPKCYMIVKLCALNSINHDDKCPFQFLRQSKELLKTIWNSLWESLPTQIEERLQDKQKLDAYKKRTNICIACVGQQWPLVRSLSGLKDIFENAINIKESEKR